jgi:nitric-oxide synthase
MSVMSSRMQTGEGEDWDGALGRRGAAAPASGGGCPVTGAARPLPPGGMPAARPDSAAPADPDEAQHFIELCYAELGKRSLLRARLAQVHAQIARHGTYQHTHEELEYGARAAWRNANRCIGRLYWHSLRIRDRRHVGTPEGIAAECFAHLREAGNRGRIRPVITVFAPDTPRRRGPRIHNEQLIRYAGHLRADGAVLGDPLHVARTLQARALGWAPRGTTAFDPLPLMISPGREAQAAEPRPRLFELPRDALLEVPLSHPALPWFAELGLRWHAVPAISDMCLEIGGICYRSAPFNGWYMGTEVGARNLADEARYDLLPEIAKRLGLEVASERSLWRDRALVELNLAVLHSFDQAGVTMADHHNESHRFLSHIQREERAGRAVPADWSWIVPPVSGAATAVFHRYYDNHELRPAFVRHAA